MKEPIFAKINVDTNKTKMYNLYLGSSMRDIIKAHRIYFGLATDPEPVRPRRIKKPWFEVFEKVYKNGVENGQSDYFTDNVKEYFQLLAHDVRPTAVLVYVSRKDIL
jgi:hypothetical protein